MEVENNHAIRSVLRWSRILIIRFNNRLQIEKYFLVLISQNKTVFARVCVCVYVYHEKRDKTGIGKTTAKVAECTTIHLGSWDLRLSQHFIIASAPKLILAAFCVAALFSPHNASQFALLLLHFQRRGLMIQRVNAYAAHPSLYPKLLYCFLHCLFFFSAILSNV